MPETNHVSDISLNLWLATDKVWLEYPWLTKPDSKEAVQRTKS